MKKTIDHVWPTKEGRKEGRKENTNINKIYDMK